MKFNSTSPNVRRQRSIYQAGCRGLCVGGVNPESGGGTFVFAGTRQSTAVFFSQSPFNVTGGVYWGWRGGFLSLMNQTRSGSGHWAPRLWTRFPCEQGMERPWSPTGAPASSGSDSSVAAAAAAAGHLAAAWSGFVVFVLVIVRQPCTVLPVWFPRKPRLSLSLDLIQRPSYLTGVQLIYDFQ